MEFNSIPFLIFFPIVAVLYFLIPFKFRWILLLAASYVFYMWWRVEYILLILFSTFLDYFVAINIDRAKEQSKKKLLLLLSLVGNLGVLMIFKYYNFFLESFTSPEMTERLYLHLLLPVGISFYTFQTLSYTIEVYRGTVKPERHLGRFAVYVAFFPQLVAGPIERPGNLLPQFLKNVEFDYDRIVSGLRLMLWGMFKKVVIADRLALVVNEVFNSPMDHNGVAITIASIFFAFQIYCDFSGYSDIAIGAAQVLGIKLMKNFDRPYFAQSIGEFWKRWHISLSTWFRDYLYIPLGGSRGTHWQWVMAILITFIVSGLWHGANWTFVIWGALHGAYYLIEKYSKSLRETMASFIKIPVVLKTLRIVWVFSIVTFAWIFFRANSLQDAIYIISHLGTGWSSLNLTELVKALGIETKDLMLSIGLIVFMEWVEWQSKDYHFGHFWGQRPLVLRWIGYAILCLVIMNLGIIGEVPFIYFQF